MAGKTSRVRIRRKAPRATSAIRPLQSGDPASAVATRVVAVLASSRYRKGSLEQLNFPSLGPSLLSAVLRRVREGAPVQLTLMAFPFKVPNPAKVGSRRLPDLAELAAIRCLLRMAREIELVYSAGVRFEIIHDGALIADVFGVGLDEVEAYEHYFLGLIERADGGATIRCHDFETLQRAVGLESGGIIDRLHHEAAEWFRSARGTPGWIECFRKTLGMMQLSEFEPAVVDRSLDLARSGTLPAEYSGLEQRVHQAMANYHVKDALIHQRDPRPLAFPGAIHATTRVQPDRLALWLVRRGSALLPWHGVGALDRNGAARVALAKDVTGDPDLTPVRLRGEATPFGYVPATMEPNFRKVVAGW